MLCQTGQMSNTRPQLLCWLMCDAVHIDPATGKHYIMGTFSNLRARNFPMKHPRMVWFMTLTEVPVGNHRILISMGLQMENLTPIVDREFESRSPLHRINLINELQGIGFDRPGLYAITVEVDNDPILVTSIAVSGVDGQ